jgi:hypothetical protein
MHSNMMNPAAGGGGVRVCAQSGKADAPKDTPEGRSEQGASEADADAKRSAAARVQHQVSNPRAGEAKPVSGGATSSGTTRTATQPNRSTEAKARASKTNRGTVERMDRPS